MTLEFPIQAKTTMSRIVAISLRGRVNLPLLREIDVAVLSIRVLRISTKIPPIKAPRIEITAANVQMDVRPRVSDRVSKPPRSGSMVGKVKKTVDRLDAMTYSTGVIGSQFAAWIKD
ncbi:hypothetical protein DRN52_08885 [Thermococci archaeon]|nr:MAG: hypothetical protein DRN52_08885 [Thermococci archaeon]